MNRNSLLPVWGWEVSLQSTAATESLWGQKTWVLAIEIHCVKYIFWLCWGILTNTLICSDFSGVVYQNVLLEVYHYPVILIKFYCIFVSYGLVTMVTKAFLDFGKENVLPIRTKVVFLNTVRYIRGNFIRTGGWQSHMASHLQFPAKSAYICFCCCFI